jgi:hypothetical protein
MKCFQTMMDTQAERDAARDAAHAEQTRLLVEAISLKGTEEGRVDVAREVIKQLLPDSISARATELINNEMLDGLKLDVKHKRLIVNRAPETLGKAFLDEAENIGVPILCTIPDDASLLEFDMERKSLFDLADDSPAVVAVDRLMEKVLELAG